MADHRKQMLHVFHHGLPEFGCEDTIGHRSDDQFCLLSSKFKYIIFPVSPCIVTIYWNIANPLSEQLPIALIVPLIALDSSTTLVSLRSWDTNTYRSSPMFFLGFSFTDIYITDNQSCLHNFLSISNN